MIEIKNVSKTFDDINALCDVTATIEDGMIFGLVGSNGAGKSTLLKTIAGIFRPDAGEITVDGLPVYENNTVKQEICFLSDSVWFKNGETPHSLSDTYRLMYPKFDEEKYLALLKRFQMVPERKINTFSKGMKKQLSVILGLSTNCRYLLLDETFDGLDPVMRQAVKGLFAAEVLEREFTPVIASHNLRELEDICDHVGLLHRGGILFTKDLFEMKLSLQKVQCVPGRVEAEEKLLQSLDILTTEKRGAVLTIVARGTEREITDKVKSLDPVFMEVLPLSLEEIFINETEAKGYDIKEFVDKNL